MTAAADVVAPDAVVDAADPADAAAHALAADYVAAAVAAATFDDAADTRVSDITMLLLNTYVLVHSQSYISPRKPKYPKTFY